MNSPFPKFSPDPHIPGTVRDSWHAVSNDDEDFDFRAVDGPTKALADCTNAVSNENVCARDFMFGERNTAAKGPMRLFVVFQIPVSMN